MGDLPQNDEERAVTLARMRRTIEAMHGPQTPHP